MNVRLVKVYKNGGTERLNYKKNEKDYNSNKDLVIKRKSKDISGDN